MPHNLQDVLFESTLLDTVADSAAQELRRDAIKCLQAGLKDGDGGGTDGAPSGGDSAATGRKLRPLNLTEEMHSASLPALLLSLASTLSAVSLSTAEALSEAVSAMAGRLTEPGLWQASWGGDASYKSTASSIEQETGAHLDLIVELADEFIIVSKVG